MINAETVLARRTQRGLSQRQLAKHTGVSYMTISRMENGADTSDLPLSVVDRLAEALDLELCDLLLRGRRATNPPMSSHEVAADTVLHDRSLDHGAARLLRRIHRGDDVRRIMSRTDRQMLLPMLVKAGLVVVSPGGTHVTPVVSSSLSVRPASESE